MLKIEKINFNPLEHPICLQMPRRNLSSTWMEHIPFALYIMDVIRPKVFVELGTFYGVSYCAFCQAVAELNLPTNCYAVDTWSGDPHMGIYDKGVLNNLRQHHDPLYSTFSTLLQSTFDDAVRRFDDGTIDLLHIDGYHTYEAVKHDFETWKPKLSRQGVVVFHDTNEYKSDFGVWKFLDELKSQYPHFEFLHGHGLGIVAVGKDIPSALLPFLKANEEEVHVIREFFQELGQRISLSIALADKKQVELDLRAEILAKNQQTHMIITLVEHYRRLVTYFLPNGTRRRQIYNFLLRGVRFILSPAAIKRALKRVKVTRRAGHIQMTIQNVIQKFGWNTSLPFINSSLKPIDKFSAERLLNRFKYKPLISLVMPTYNTPIQYLETAIRSVQRQYYPCWELCICDDGSTNTKTRDTLRAINNARIKIIFLEQNEGISTATNEAVKIANGEFIAFLDHDDELTPDALFEMVRLLNEKPDLDAIYSDQDKINQKGKQCEPFFKPDWSPEYMRSVMYAGHLLMLRRELFKQVGGSAPGFDGVQDYELMLRVSEQTKKISHIPKILYHWRMTPGSIALGINEKGAKIERLQVKAVNAHLERLKLNAEALQHPTHRHRVIVRPKPRVDYPKISVIIVSQDASEHIAHCLESIFGCTTYPNYEVVVVHNKSTNPMSIKTPGKYPIRIVAFDQAFNTSFASNLGAQSASGDIIVLLNNDTKIVTADWLEQMLFFLDDPDVAVVGPMLLFPDKTVHHAGSVLGLHGTANNIMRGHPSTSDGYAGSLSCPRNVSAVTSACMMVRRMDYLNSGGFLEYYVTQYQDVDLCLRFLSAGKRIVYVPYAVLIQPEDTTHNEDYDHLDRALFMDTWDELIARGDPYHNPNFPLDSTDYIID